MDKEYNIIQVERWECPVKSGAPILTMPNIPHALHGEGLQPRTILGKTTWDHMRKRCYYEAEYKSEITGEVPPKGQLHAHELFSYDYDKQEGVFQRCIALTKREHDFIHSGRLLTMFNNGVAYYPKSYVLDVIENGFRIISDYNKEHPNDLPLRCFSTILDGLKNPDLAKELAELIEKYDIKFYEPHIPRHKRWKGWHVIVGNKRYDTPYANQRQWKAAMDVYNSKDTVRNSKSPFAGDAYKELREAMKGIETQIAGCKDGRLSKRKQEKKNEQ